MENNYDRSSPNDGEIPGRSPVTEAWGQFGDVIDAMKSSWRGIGAFLKALEVGEIRARTSRDPPATGDEILDAGGSPSPQWWRDYERYCNSEPSTPTAWTLWLRTSVEVELAPVQRLFLGDLEEERKHFRSGQIYRRQDAVWSDLEALAWFASEDYELVARLRDFGHHQKGLKEKAQARGLRYLSFYVARSHCQCGVEEAPLGIGATAACTCVKSAWDRMVSSLQSGKLGATAFKENGDPRPVKAKEFLIADSDLVAGRFSLLRGSWELLFEQSHVQAAALSSPAQCSNEEISEWIDNHPEYTNVKTARDAFMKEPRAKGLSATFEKIWQDKFRRKPGRRRKDQT